MKSAITQLLKYEIVQNIKDDLFVNSANTYVGIGRPIRWGDAVDPEANNEIEDVVYTTNYRNQVWRDMVAMKRVESASIYPVVPRRDWVSGIQYDPYADGVELFSHCQKLAIGTVDASGNLVTTNTAVFTGNISTGNLITITANTSETKEVIAVLNTTTVVINSNVSTAYTNANCIRVSNSYPQFANNFYVRNSKDQVFKCLFNADTVSTIEPTIDIDGQLPENPYILTGDGYKWKYLYTVPYGLKQKFFTKNWMPVISDAAVVAGSTDGRIDVINIVDGGTGYFLDNGESGNSNSLAILTVTGDGSGANVTAKIESGVITDLNILDGGSGYTRAEILINDPDQLSNGNTAVFEVAISPYGGHGSDPARELGCYSVMVSVDLDGTESDTIPVGTDTDPFDFRQITLVRDPLDANGVYANASVYRTTTKLSLTDPGTTNYTNDETVYIGTGLDEATFTATVVNWDPNTNELFVNNLSGNVIVGSTLTGNVSAATATILSQEDPTIGLFGGDILYIENRNKIVRNVDQTEQIRLVLSF
jgi:hypothetical protein